MTDLATRILNAILRAILRATRFVNAGTQVASWVTPTFVGRRSTSV
jgi:hypothetical protein